jgi:hypothetical protein
MRLLEQVANVDDTFRELRWRPLCGGLSGFVPGGAAR